MIKRDLKLWIVIPVLAAAITLLPLSLIAHSEENVSQFVQGLNQITDWFRYLSESFDKIVEIEGEKQLIRRVKKLSQALYKLEKEREGAVRNWLKVFHLDNRKINCESLYPNFARRPRDAWYKCQKESVVMLQSYNEGLKKFRAQMKIVEKGFYQFGRELRAKGLKGEEVERIISVGLGSWMGPDAIVLSAQGSVRFDGAYMPLQYDKSADPQDILKSALEESERCITALHRAQEAAREFLEYLKKAPA